MFVAVGGLLVGAMIPLGTNMAMVPTENNFTKIFPNENINVYQISFISDIFYMVFPDFKSAQI